MKIVDVALGSFLLGIFVTGLAGLKLSNQVSYQFVIGKLSDNVTFYRQIESGKSELTQKSIASSLGWFIALAEDGEHSIWVTSTESDKQILIRSKDLYKQITENKKPTSYK